MFDIFGEKNKRILLIESNLDAATLILRQLSKDYDIEHVSIPEGISHIVGEYDAVIANIWATPYLLDFKRIRNACEKRDVPLLAISNDVVSYHENQLAIPFTARCLELFVTKIMKKNKAA